MKDEHRQDKHNKTRREPQQRRHDTVSPAKTLTAVKSDPFSARVAGLERADRGVQPLSRGAAESGLPRQRSQLDLGHRAQGPTVNVCVHHGPVKILDDCVLEDGNKKIELTHTRNRFVRKASMLQRFMLGVGPLQSSTSVIPRFRSRLRSKTFRQATTVSWIGSTVVFACDRCPLA